jgi:hypothetical protein
VIDEQDLLLLRLEAMRSVHHEDTEFTLRSICRWYSQRFATPLHEVGTPTGAVALEEVLRTFYEVRYQEMKGEEDKLEKEIQELVLTPEEAQQAAMAADAAEADNWRFNRDVTIMVQAKNAAAAAAAAAARRKEAEKSLDDTHAPATQERVLTNRPLPEASLSDVVPRPPPPAAKPPPKAQLVRTNLPENEQIVFMTDEEMEADAVDPFSIERPPRPSRKKK